MNNSKLKIKYGNIEFEIESDPTTIEKERKAFLDTLPNITVLSQFKEERNSEVIESSADKKLLSTTHTNLNSFMRDKGFNTDLDKCLGVIYFMDKIEKISEVDSNMVKERMQKAKLPIPKSPSVAFNSMTTKGFIQPIEKDEKGLTKYYITSDGEIYIDEFVKSDKKIKVSIKKNSNKPLETRYPFLTKEMMNLEKYPDYYSLKTSRDKIMIIMYILKDINKGEFFTVNDISYIISKIFNDKLSIDSIKGVFKNKSTAKYFDKKNIEDNKKIFEYKILDIGIRCFKNEIIDKK